MLFNCFQQLSTLLVPIAARWNKPPAEGDKFIACEIDWGVTTPVGQAVQISLTAGPVALSQIVAFSVDNGRSGSDVSFIFPDTGKQLTVPAFAQGVYPVFTGSLSFYVMAEVAAVGDVTQFEILNSLPPPVSVLPSQLQSHSGVTGIGLVANLTTPIIPAGVNGTLQGFAGTFFVPAAATDVVDRDSRIAKAPIPIAPIGASPSSTLSPDRRPARPLRRRGAARCPRAQPPSPARARRHRRCDWRAAARASR